MPLLELHRIEKSFGLNRVLRGVDLAVESGEVHALLGANGAGKSTLIKILAGIYARDAGDVLLDGQALRLAAPADALREGIAVIHQEFAQAANLTVAENLFLGEEPRRRVGPLSLVDRASMRRAAAEHLGRLQFSLDPGARAGDLRTGEKQMLEIATALRRRARLLILDEPTAALTHSEVRQLFRLMRELRGEGIGMIYISHHLEEVFEVADRVTVLRDGLVAGNWAADQATEADLVTAMTGRAVMRGAVESRTTGEAVVLGDRLAGDSFYDVSFQVREGEIFALTGAAGAGHGELLYALAGALPRKGLFTVRGKTVKPHDPPAAASAGIAIAPGDRKRRGILPQLDVRLNLTFPRLKALSSAGVLNWPAVDAEASRLVSRCAVRCEGLRQPVDTLSGGNQQKVVVGRLAGAGAQLFLFDEPTRGVDVGSREEIYSLIHELAASGAGVMVATPDPAEARRLGDKVLVFRQGRVVLEVEGAATTDHELTAAVIGGEPVSRQDED